MLLTFDHQVKAGTPSIGKINAGVPRNIMCGTHQRVSGLKIVYEYADVIGDLTIRCQNISHDGKWGSVGGYTNFANNAPNSSYQWQDSAECPRDSFATAIYGQTTSVPFAIPPGSQIVLNEVGLICGTADNDGRLKSEKTGISVQAETPGREVRSGYSPSEYCDNRGFARGIKIAQNPINGIAVGQVNGSGIIWGVSLHCAQGTPEQPINYDPPTLSAPSLNKSDNIRAPGARQSFTITGLPSHSSHNTEYEICLTLGGLSRCNTRTRVSAGSTPYYLTLDEQFEGRAVNWSAKTCNKSSTRAGLRCGNFAKPQQFYVLPNVAQLQRPMANARNSVRTVQFSWNARSSATAGYQLVIWNANKQPRYNHLQPSANSHVNGVSVNITVPRGETGRRVDVPGDLGNQLEWAVFACTDFNRRDRKRHCAKPIRQGRVLNLAGGRTSSTRPLKTFGK